MKIELFLGRKSCAEVRYCRVYQAPVVFGGKIKSVVINLRLLVLAVYF